MKGDERREEVTRNRWRERREGRGCGEEWRKRSAREGGTHQSQLEEKKTANEEPTASSSSSNLRQHPTRFQD